MSTFYTSNSLKIWKKEENVFEQIFAKVALVIRNLWWVYDGWTNGWAKIDAYMYWETCDDRIFEEKNKPLKRQIKK